MISDIQNIDKSEQHLYQAAVFRCFKMVKEDHINIKDAVEKIVLAFEALVSDPDMLKKILYQEITQESSTHNVIMAEEVRKRDWWTKLKTSKDFSKGYWDRYYDYLTAKPGWSATSIKDLDDSTDEVMNALANPRNGGSEERRGLVYGDVQSGKTAHYIGLINKAYASGYKIINLCQSCCS